MNNADDFKKTKPNKANPSILIRTGFEIGFAKMGHLEFLLLDLKDTITILLKGKKYGHQ